MPVKPTTVGTAPTLAANPTGFTFEYLSPELGGGALGAGTGPVRLLVYKRVVGATPPTGTVNVTFNGTSSPRRTWSRSAMTRPGTRSPWEALVARLKPNGRIDHVRRDGQPRTSVWTPGTSTSAASIASDDDGEQPSTPPVGELHRPRRDQRHLEGGGTSVTTTGNDLFDFLYGKGPDPDGPSTGAPVAGRFTSNSAETGGGVFLRVRATGTPAGGTTHDVWGSTPVVTTAGGAPTSTQLARGQVDVVTTTGGAPTLVAPGTTHDVWGSTPVVTTTGGAPSLRAQAAGPTPITTTTGGAPTSTQLARGSTPVVTTAGGAPTSTQLARGQTPVVTTSGGAPSLLGKAAGQVDVVTTTGGAPTSTQLARGQVDVITTAGGAPTLIGGAVVHAVYGSTPVVTTAGGAPTARLQAAGPAPITTTAGGAPTLVGKAAGSTPIVTTAGGAPTLRAQAAGSTPVESPQRAARRPSWPCVRGSTPVITTTGGAPTILGAVAPVRGATIAPHVSGGAATVGGATPTGGATVGSHQGGGGATLNEHADSRGANHTTDTMPTGNAVLAPT